MDKECFAWLRKRREYAAKVLAIKPSCPECGTQQVQIINVDKQHWKCRHCHIHFFTFSHEVGE